MDKTFTIERTITIDPDYYANNALEDLVDNLTENLEVDHGINTIAMSELCNKIHYEVLKTLIQKAEEIIESYEREGF